MGLAGQRALLLCRSLIVTVQTLLFVASLLFVSAVQIRPWFVFQLSPCFLSLSSHETLGVHFTVRRPKLSIRRPIFKAQICI